MLDHRKTDINGRVFDLPAARGSINGTKGERFNE